MHIISINQVCCGLVSMSRMVVFLTSMQWKPMSSINWDILLSLELLAAIKHIAADMPAWRAKCFASVLLSLFFNDQLSSHIIWERTGQIFSKFSGLVDVWKGLISQIFILRLFKQEVAMQPILEAKSVKLAYPPSFIAAIFRNELEYSNTNWCTDSADDSPNHVEIC